MPHHNAGENNGNHKYSDEQRDYAEKLMKQGYTSSQAALKFEQEYGVRPADSWFRMINTGKTRVK